MSINSKEKKLQKIAAELIPKKLKDNLLNLTSDICVDINEYQEFISKGETATIFEQVKELVRELYDTIIQPFDKRNDFLEKTYCVKKNVLETIQYLNTYNHLCSLTFKLASDEKALLDFHNDESVRNLKFNYQKMMMDCLDFIYSSEDDSEDDSEFYDFDSKRKQSMILSCLPLKMTKQKYNCFLENFLHSLLDDSSKAFVAKNIDSLKRCFAPFKEELLGNRFPDILNPLMEYWKTDYSKVSYEKIDSDIQSLIDIGESIYENLGFVNSLYNDINYIINIVSFSVDEEYLFQDDLMFKDLYFSTRNIIDSKDNEIFIEELLERIYDNIEISKTECDALDDNFNDILEMIGDYDNISEDTETYICTIFDIDKNFLKTPEMDSFLYNNLENTEKNVTDEEFLNKKIDEFINFTKNSLSGFKNKVAKQIKANFFEKTAYPFDNNEFKDYLKFVFDDLGNNDRDCLVAFHIDRVFTIENFELDLDDNIDSFDIDDNEECECHHHHHHHNHN